MQPKVENIATLVAKRDIAITSLDELYEEFNRLYQAEPELIRFGQIKSGLAELSNRHGKFWTLNSEIREK